MPGAKRIAIFLLGLAEMTGVGIQEAVEAKLAANQERVYRRLPNDVLVKAKIPSPPLPHPRSDIYAAAAVVERPARSRHRVSGDDQHRRSGREDVERLLAV
jgi:hypothetical protein